MTELEKALDRLNGAVSTLLDASERGQSEQDQADRSKQEARIAELTAERDKLRAERDKLRAEREEDAKLRAEAADAVKAALGDLRTLLAAQNEDASEGAGQKAAQKAAHGGRNG